MNKKFFKKVRAWEKEIEYAPPSRAAALAKKIVKYKPLVFGENQ